MKPADFAKYLWHLGFEAHQAYVAAGRPLRDLTHAELHALFCDSYRAMATAPNPALWRRVLEAQSELTCRGRQPPYDLVRPAYAAVEQQLKARFDAINQDPKLQAELAEQIARLDGTPQ
jgi:hypothetical protein